MKTVFLMFVYVKVGELKLVFRMYRSCLLKLIFIPHFLRVVVEVEASGPLHVL